jgi:hypothetical protein
MVLNNLLEKIFNKYFEELPHLKSLILTDDIQTPGFFNFKELYDFHDGSHLL